MAAREILAFFGIGVDDSGLKKADAGIEATIGGLATLGASFAGVYGVVSFTKNLIEMGAALENASLRSKGNVHDIQQWKFAAERSGTSAEEFGASMKFLNKNLAAAAEGGGTAGPAFQKLGVKIKDSDGHIRKTSDVLLDVADGFGKIDSGAQRTLLAMEIFGKGGTAMLGFLNAGSKDIKVLLERFDELGGGLSKEFTESAKKADDALIDLSIVSKSVKNAIGVELLPTVAAGIERFVNFAATLLKTFKGTNAVRVALLGLGAASIFSGIKLATGAAKSLGLLKNLAGKSTQGLMGTARALYYLAKAALNVGLKIGILFLILEDLYTLFTGGKSAIGAFIDGIFGVGTAAKAVESVKAAFSGLVELIRQGSPELRNFTKIAVDLLKDAFKGFEGTRSLFADFFTQLAVDINKAYPSLKATYQLLLSISQLLRPKLDVKDFSPGASIDARLQEDADFEQAVASGAFAKVPAAQAAKFAQENHTQIIVNGGKGTDVATAVADKQSDVNNKNAASLKAVARP